MYRRVLPWLIAVFIIFLSNNPMLADASEHRAEENIKVLVFKIGHPNYYLEDRFGTVSENEMDTSPYIKSGRTFVPVRFLANALGIPDHSISWNPSTRAVTLTGNTAVHMVIGSKEMQSGGKTVVMDTAPEIIPPGRTMLPARYVAEGVGFKVDWDPDRQLVVCYPEGQPAPDLAPIIAEIEGKKPAEKPEPQPKSVEERYQEARSNGGFFKEEQLDAEMADYLWNEVIDYDKEERVKVSDEKWAIIRMLLMDTDECQKQFPRCPYEITSITPSKYLVSSNYKESWCCYCFINGNQLAFATVYLNFGGYDIKWGTFLSENVFEGMGIPDWRLLGS